ncbi:hypothetical protein WJX73_005872 [Symbiochloris irregularis]|uniref:Endoplasmic reticulum oxidoreductin 1 n=1 Tax=Symbiochloris irregularis TaxID=706552 RepID=A0AAW1P7R0_9CHLO
MPADPAKQKIDRSRTWYLAFSFVAVAAAGLLLQSSGPAPSFLQLLPFSSRLPWAGSACHHSPPESTQVSEPGVGVCQLSGPVLDCSCDYASVERINRDHINAVLRDLVHTPFFQYFKVDLYSECPFWPDDGLCMMRDCSVTECEAVDVPDLWVKAETETEPSECGAQLLDQEAEVEEVEGLVREQLLAIPGWRGVNNPWMPGNDTVQDFSYVNLLENPERFTGYQGEHPHRIWDLIYSQQCWQDTSDLCHEAQIFFRLISGMHASISAHIANDYLLSEVQGLWGPSLAQFRQRFGGPAAAERVSNLYFTYLFVLRAVLKAAPTLQAVAYSTGNAAQDLRTAALVQQLVTLEAVRTACPVPFDEGRLWKGEDGPALKRQLQTHFQNITAAMDCVGCHKCKLWGKLQLLGIATSLKILFSSDDCTGATSDALQLSLERNEVIALMNLLERLSHSIEVVRVMSAQLLGSSQPSLGSIEEVTHTLLQKSISSFSLLGQAAVIVETLSVWALDTPSQLQARVAFTTSLRRVVSFPMERGESARLCMPLACTAASLRIFSHRIQHVQGEKVDRPSE